MSQQEIERLHQDTWRKYNQGLISSAILVQQVEYCAENMELFDANRASEMRASIRGY